MGQPLRKLDDGRPVALLAVRVIIGGLFIVHGVDKLATGVSTVESMFASWGVPAVIVTSAFTLMLELIAGAALVAGLATRLASAALALLLVFAIYYVKIELGVISSGPMPGAELDLAYIAGLLVLITHGAGRWSLDARRSTEVVERRVAVEQELAA